MGSCCSFCHCTVKRLGKEWYEYNFSSGKNLWKQDAREAPMLHIAVRVLQPQWRLHLAAFRPPSSTSQSTLVPGQHLGRWHNLNIPNRVVSQEELTLLNGNVTPLVLIFGLTQDASLEELWRRESLVLSNTKVKYCLPNILQQSTISCTCIYSALCWLFTFLQRLPKMKSVDLSRHETRAPNKHKNIEHALKNNVFPAGHPSPPTMVKVAWHCKLLSWRMVFYPRWCYAPKVTVLWWEPNV